MKKKVFAVLMSAMMALSLAACGGSAASSPAATDDSVVSTADGQAAGPDSKVGLICGEDENSGYDASHIDGCTAAIKALGIDEKNLIIKKDIPEDESCYDNAVDLAEEGCSIIFSDSYGHQSYMMQAATEYPDVTFVACTGDMAASSGLDNYKNIFPHTYESRYVSGVVAGMKLKEMIDNGEISAADAKIGYVGAYPYAEVISGFTAFFLGVRSEVPEATMKVLYTNSWADPAAEAETAKQLISDGCVLISQHADTTGAPTSCQEEGVPCVGYNVSMLSVAPDVALTSPTNNWEV